MQLTVLPITLDTAALAAGLYNLFTEDERIRLQFGLLPAQKISILQRQLRKTLFRILGREDLADTGVDQMEAMVNSPGGPEYQVFSFKALVSEAMHEILLELLKLAEMVV